MWSIDDDRRPRSGRQQVGEHAERRQVGDYGVSRAAGSAGSSTWTPDPGVVTVIQRIGEALVDWEVAPLAGGGGSSRKIILSSAVSARR
jgi:hypothetical protein